MPWVTPKTDWASDPVGSGDFNRGEGNTLYLRNVLHFSGCSGRDFSIEAADVFVASYAVTVTTQSIRLLRASYNFKYDTAILITCDGGGSSWASSSSFGYTDNINTELRASGVGATVNIDVYARPLVTNYARQIFATAGWMFELLVE